MADNWTSLDTTSLVPQPLKDLSGGLEALTSLTTTLLNGIKTALEAAKLLAQAPTGNPLELALQAAISELNAFLEGLLKQTAVHAIFIPIQKQPNGRGKRPLQALPEERLTSFDDLLERGAFSGVDLNDFPPETISFINTAETAVGGNAGFWKAFSQSLTDRGDEARPQFPDTFAVTGTCLLFGADTLRELQANFDLFASILKLSPKADLAARTRPIMTNLSGKTLLVTEESPARIAVQLEWANVSPIHTFELYSGETCITKELFVVRSTDMSFRTKTTWSSVFSRQPTEIPTDLQRTGNTKVIARINNDGLVTRYLDTDPDLQENQVYYYGTAIRYEMDGEVQPMSNFSNITRVQLTRPKESKQGEFPDWVATPSLVSLFPVIEEIINQAKLVLAGASTRSVTTAGITNNLNLTINQIDRLVAEAESINTRIIEATDKLNAILNQSLTAGIYSTTVTVATGGIGGWGAELAKRLSDTSDTSRPPFDSESALVAGFIVVGGAPNLPALAALTSMLEVFFGSAEPNAVADAIDTLETSVRAKEEITFDDSLTPTRTKV